MILLPVWKTCLEALERLIKIMLQDVSTRWNSTYNMLSFVVQYRKAIEHMTSNCRNDLWQFEMLEEEWEIVEAFQDMLKVCAGRMTNMYLHQQISARS